MEAHNPESVRPFQMRAASWNCIEKIDLSVSIQVVEPLLLNRWCHTEKGCDQAKMRENTTIEKISDLPHKQLRSIIRPNTEVVRQEGCEFCIRVEVSVQPSSTIDVYGLSGDVVGVVRGEERRHLDDVFRSLFLLHWDSLFDDFLKQLSACQFLRIEAR